MKQAGEAGWVYFPKAISGVDGPVGALASRDSVLYAGGTFNLAGKVAARNIAAWDGHAWSALGEGLANPVNRIAVDGQGVVYAYTVSGYPMLSRWDGRAWNAIADTIEGDVEDLSVDSANRLRVSGAITKVGGVGVANGALWDGTSWKRADAPGPSLLDSKGRVFAYRINAEEATFQAYRLQDTAWVEQGGRFRFESAPKGNLTARFDALGRLMLMYGVSDEEGNEKNVLRRMDKDGKWRILSSELPDVTAWLPDLKNPARIWLETGSCLYAFEKKLSETLDGCHSGSQLIQMKNGQLVTGGELNYTQHSLQAYIARLSGDTWVGIDTAGVDFGSYNYRDLSARKSELLKKITDKDRPQILAPENLGDIVADAKGGLYVAGEFQFEKDGVSFRRVAYWKDNVYSSLGPGIWGSNDNKDLRLALAPDGSLYAANAALRHVGSASYCGLFRWDGKVWNYVRTTPHVIDMAFDKQGNLYGLVTKDNNSRRWLGRIPVDSGDGDLDNIGESLDRFGANRMEMDDSLIHLYGDFLRANDTVSPGHVAWRIPEHPVGKRMRPAKDVSSTDRIRLLKAGQEGVGLVDSIWVEQSASYSLYNATGNPFDSVWLHMKRIEGLQMEAYTPKRLGHPLTAKDYSVVPEPGGYLVKVCLRDSVTDDEYGSLNIKLVRKGLIGKSPPKGYVFQDTLYPLVKSEYEVGIEESHWIHIGVGPEFPIQGKRHPKDTLVSLKTPSFIRWVVNPDPDRLPDPFFADTIHQSKWYAHLLRYNTDGDSELVKANPLPPGLTKEIVARDLWSDPIAPSDSEVEYVCNVYARPWINQRAPTYMVFFETSNFRNEEGFRIVNDKRKLRLGLYRQDAEGRYQLAAKAEAIEFEWDAKVMSTDAEPYPLTGKETAFEVRMTQNFGYAGGGGTDEFLMLFRVKGTVLTPILSTLMSSTSMTAGEWSEDGTREHFDHDGGSATLEVLKTKTRGFFDVKKADGNKSAVFKWDGESYELKGEDPISEVNVEK